VLGNYQRVQFHRMTSAIVIAALISFAHTCALHAGMNGVALVSHEVEPHDHASAENHTNVSHASDAEGDDCCGHAPGSSSAQMRSCCSSWSAGQGRYSLPAPMLLSGMVPLSSIATHVGDPSIGTLSPQRPGRSPTAGPPGLHSILRL
jgi:hypothetical protein